MKMALRGVFSAVLLVALVCGVVTSRAVAAISIVTTSQELADIAKQVGGDYVSVYSIGQPNRDLHFVEPRPSDVSRIASANMVVRIGMDLDLWMDALLDAAGNPQVLPGGPGYVDASVRIKKLEVPTEQITGASGDIHAYGNPHYFYDPIKGKMIAWEIMDGLCRISPDNTSYFVDHYKAFAQDIDTRMEDWKKELAPYEGRYVVTYHKSAIYFLTRFGLHEFGTLEPKPGIAPSAAHVSDLIQGMKANHVTAVVIESIYPTRFPDLITRETGVKYVAVPYSVGALDTENYQDLIDRWVQGYKKAFRQ